MHEKPKQWMASLGEFGREVLEVQLEAFRKKFGRDPLRTDPVFFDPDKDVPTLASEVQAQELRVTMTKLLLQALPGKPELAYAFKKTGILLTESNAKNLPRESVEEFETAARQYVDLAWKGEAPKII